MGLSIHYSGTIKEYSLIQLLMEEVQDICTVMNWPYKTVSDDKVKGILFTPPECETLSYTFTPDGKLVSLFMLVYNILPATTTSVKTQFAGIEVHKVVIKLMRHISQKYFSVFELSDEGEYWETDNEQVLQRKFGMYNSLMNSVQTALQDFKGVDEETAESLADRLEKFLNKRL